MDSNSKNPAPSHSNSNNHKNIGIENISICKGNIISADDQTKIKSYIQNKYPSLDERYLKDVIKLLSQEDPAATHENAASIEECVTGFIAYTKLEEKLKNVAKLKEIKRPTSGSVDFIVTFTLTDSTKNEFTKNIADDKKEAFDNYLNKEFEFGIDPFGSLGDLVNEEDYISALEKHTNNTKSEGTAGFQTVGVAHTYQNNNDYFNSFTFQKKIADVKARNDNFNLVIISNIDMPESNSTIDYKKDIIQETVLNTNQMPIDIGGVPMCGDLFE
ncbi:hypothetical protein [Aeromonas jandaei]|uniref:hypothetical protein n=1 Tax=Aeromonas jandaei TaxID=650 RepID=UPI0038B58DA4